MADLWPLDIILFFNMGQMHWISSQGCVDLWRNALPVPAGAILAPAATAPFAFSYVIRHAKFPVCAGALIQ
jgi:hypothetical protein